MKGYCRNSECRLMTNTGGSVCLGNPPINNQLLFAGGLPQSNIDVVNIYIGESYFLYKIELYSMFCG